MEIVEPNTPWKLKPNTLSEKNQHGVNLSKIKRALIDFDSNIDLEKLVAECKSESGISMNGTSPQSAKPRPKPGSFISNFDQYLNNVDWALPEPDTYIENSACWNPTSMVFDDYKFLNSTCFFLFYFNFKIIIIPIIKARPFLLTTKPRQLVIRKTIMLTRMNLTSL